MAPHDGVPEYPHHLPAFDYVGVQRYFLTLHLARQAVFGFLLQARDEAAALAAIRLRTRLEKRGGHHPLARYIVENPVRARLVKSALDYPFWGSSTWLREELVEYVRQNI